MWCDSFDYRWRECEKFIWSLWSDRVFFINNDEYIKKNNTIRKNFEKNGMNILMEGVSKIQTMEAKIYKLGVDTLIRDGMDVSIEAPTQISLLWPSARRIADNGEFCMNALLYAGKAI